MKLGSLTRTFTLALAASAFGVGCTAHAELVGEAEGPPPPPPPVVFTQQPALVSVDSGVWVVRDSDYPVYNVDGAYWAYRDNVWYRSNSYEGGWVVSPPTVVPPTIVSRDHQAFVHYHGAASAEVRPAPRAPMDRSEADVRGRPMQPAQEGARVEAAREQPRPEVDREHDARMRAAQAHPEPVGHAEPRPESKAEARPELKRDDRERGATAHPAEARPPETHAPAPTPEHKPDAVRPPAPTDTRHGPLKQPVDRSR